MVQQVSPIRILRARAEARAILYRAHEFDFGEATDPLLAYAEAAGLIEQLGIELVSTIILAPFVEPP